MFFERQDTQITTDTVFRRVLTDPRLRNGRGQGEPTEGVLYAVQ